MSTVSVSVPNAPDRYSLNTALIITWREVRDNLRDWRIVVPILTLTLVFPFLMDFTAHVARDFVVRYGGENAIIAERLNPFLLLIVGFFPITFSLVIALETFVGEKERNSLEPLLSTPVSDGELYLGKMLAALILPLSASYLGITTYLVGLYLTMGWLPPFSLVGQILLLTTVEGLVMVSGAVIVSSQTTSVRAANLLASFIIIPMALMVQVQSIIMFWGRYQVIWWVIGGLVVVDLILVRMGMRIFNREEILWMYVHDIPTLIRSHGLPLLVVLISLAGAALLGGFYATHYPVPEGIIALDSLPQDAFENLPEIDFLPRFNVTGIFLNNLRSLLLAGVLAVFSFGALALILLMIPVALIGFFAVEVAILGYSPWVFLAAFILPHGVIELPAAIIATAFALRVGAALVSPPAGLDVGQGLLLVLADFVKVFFLLVVPLLLIAAVIEVHLTPQIVLALYGGG
jgi:uncharacterized membrane protein SpoIIM required for sporulation/ABC-type transport system involved in multi-copper enzyme maturation permease subunit